MTVVYHNHYPYGATGFIVSERTIGVANKKFSKKQAGMTGRSSAKRVRVGNSSKKSLGFGLPVVRLSKKVNVHGATASRITVGVVARAVADY